MIDFNLTQLKEALKKVVVKSERVLHTKEIRGITQDSRSVEKDFVFIATKGYHADGHHYIDNAIENGATLIIAEDASFADHTDVDYILVEDSKLALAQVAKEYYKSPSDSLTIVAVTGTNGKTTVATLLYQAFMTLGYNCGLLSTIKNIIGTTAQDSKLTTPDVLALNKLLYQMVHAKVTHVFMEASSHALVQGRLDGIDINVAVFTNLTRDHLDYHGTFLSYIQAKKLLFDNLPKDAYALVNIDDTNGRVMLQNSKAQHYHYALKRPADFKAKILSNTAEGLHLQVDESEVYLKLLGDFNAYNALAVYGVMRLLEIDQLESLRILSTLGSVEGRLEVLKHPGVKYMAVVDYAHTPDALESILKTLISMKKQSGQIITVVGCGGNRDRGKRPLMAKVAVDKSDVIVFTSDNPRDEDPEDIIVDMMEGLGKDERKKVIKQVDRKEAIKMATILAKENDIILIAGKGHEKYQIIKGQKYPFDDKEIINAFMH